MANLKEVKSRISSVTSTQQITKAMKMVSAAKLRRAQDAIGTMRPYAQKLSEILRNVSSGATDEKNPYAEERKVRRVLIIAITSDKGLAGAFNLNIMRRIRVLLAEDYRTQAEQGDVEIMPIGRKAYDFYRRNKEQKLQTQFHNLYSNLSFDEARRAAEFAMDEFVNGTYDKVVVVYNEFKNVATQIVQTQQLLPLPKAEKSKEKSKATNIDYIFEPSKEEIIEELIPKSIKIQLYKDLLDSNAAEHGARMTAMDKATDNAGELLKELKLVYNRTRQAAITTEILEIVAGAEALSSSR